MLHVHHAMQGHSATARRGPTKTKTDVAHPARSNRIVAWLDQYCERSDLGAPMFMNPKTRDRWSHGASRDTWKKAAESIGSDVGFYQGTKHTRATDWLAEEQSERLIQAALGHSNIQSTHKYARLKPSALVELIGNKKSSTQQYVAFVCSLCAHRSRVSNCLKVQE
jgi:integrase